MIMIGLSIPLVALIVYILWVCWKHPHVRRMVFREAAASKMTAILTVVGLSVGTSMLTIVVSIEWMVSAGTDNLLKQHFGKIAYEVPAIRQASPVSYYYTEQEMRRLRETAAAQSDDFAPMMSYALTAFPSEQRSDDRMLPNMLVIGMDPAQSVRWIAGQLREEWPMDWPRNGIVLSRTAAERLDVSAGDSVDVSDLQNRRNRFQVLKVLEDQGLMGYRGVQNAAATAVIGEERARELFGLPEGAYTSAIVAGAPPGPPWQTVPVLAEAETGMFEWARMISSSFLLISLNAIVMSVILTLNLIRMMLEERRFGLGILQAIGFSRVDLKRILRVEALLYAVFACLPGGLAGIAWSKWLMERFDRLSADSASLAGTLDFGAGLRVGAAGGSVALVFAYASIWLVTHRLFAASRSPSMNPIRPVGRMPANDAAASLHVFVSWFVLEATLVFLMLAAIPKVRYEWFRDADILLVPVILLVMTPFLSYAGVRWMEGLGRWILRLFRGIPRAYAMLYLAFKQLADNRMRSGLSILLFCAVSGLVSFSIVISGYLQFALKQADPREGIGGFDYYAEDIRLTTSMQLQSYLDNAGFAPAEAPTAASVVQLPWNESHGLAYMVNGVDRPYAESTLIPVKPVSETADSRELWRMLAEDPEAVIVSSAAWQYIKDARWERDGETISFPVNGNDVRKRVIGIVEDRETYFPFMKGIWMNAGETIRLGRGSKTMHTVLFLRFDTPEAAVAGAHQAEQALAANNIHPLIGAAESDTGYFRNFERLLKIFEQSNFFAMVIGISGAAIVMIRSVKQRRQQLGALRAIGIPSRGLLLYIWIEGAASSLFGTILGFAIGGYLSYMVCVSQTASIGMIGYGPPTSQLLLSFMYVVALIAGGTFLTAWYAYRVPPAQSMKYHTV